jgi:hypothetical protein
MPEAIHQLTTGPTTTALLVVVVDVSNRWPEPEPELLNYPLHLARSHSFDRNSERLVRCR